MGEYYAMIFAGMKRTSESTGYMTRRGGWPHIALRSPSNRQILGRFAEQSWTFAAESDCGGFSAAIDAINFGSQTADCSCCIDLAKSEEI